MIGTLITAGRSASQNAQAITRITMPTNFSRALMKADTFVFQFSDLVFVS